MHHRNPGQLLVLLAIATFALFSQQVHAQFDRFDKSRLIETMRDRGMNELLLHYAKNAKLDKVDAKTIQVSIHRANGDNPGVTVVGRKKQFIAALEILKELISDKALKAEPKRIMWQSEFAEISFYKLFFLHATQLVYEYGEPDQEQREDFEKYVLDAFLMLNEAELQVFKLRTSFPNIKDYLIKYESTGLADRILNEYGEMRIPFMSAVAHYYMSLMPSTHPYFKNKYPQVQRKMSTYKGEKERLLKSAIAKLDNIVESPDVQEQLKAMANSFKGRAYMRLGKIPQGQSILSDATQASEMGGLNRLVCQMGIAHGLGVVTTRTQPALRILQPLYDYPLVKPSQPFQIMLADLEHKVLKRTAGKDLKKIAASFKPYERLMKKDDAFKGFLNKRWAARVKKPSDILKLPPMAALGVGEMKLAEAQESNNAKQLKEVEAIFANVAKSAGASNMVKATALHRQALSVYFINRNELSRIKQAVELMIQVGEKYPKEKVVAMKAVSEAVGMLPQIIESNKGDDVKELAKLYEKGMKVIYKNFPSSKAASEQMVYYAERYLFNREKYQECADLLLTLTEDHPLFYEGQRLLLESKVEIYKDANQRDDRDLINTMVADLANTINDIKSKVSGKQKPAAKYTGATVNLVEAELALERDLYLVAMKNLEGFEDRFDVSSFPELLAKAVRIRVTAAGNMGEAAKAEVFIKRLYDEFPDQAGPVTHNMLQDFLKQIDQMDSLVATLPAGSQKTKYQRRVKALSSVGSVMSKYMLKWVRDRESNLPNAQGMILGYQLTLAKLMIQSDQAKGAIEIVKQARQANPDDANVIFYFAEVYYFAGKTDKQNSNAHLSVARKEFSYLATNLDPENVTGVKGTPLETIWWQSWLRLIQMMDFQKKNTDRIWGLIHRLKAQDENLGGFTKQFDRLQKLYPNTN